MKLNLSEGIRPLKDSFTVDLSSDVSDKLPDYVKLVGIDKISESETKWYKVKFYYSFAVDSSALETHGYTGIRATNLSAKIARWLKANTFKEDGQKFINHSAEHFAQLVKEPIDIITYPESASKFNQELALAIASKIGLKHEAIIPNGFAKKSPEDIRVDLPGMREKYIDQFDYEPEANRYPIISVTSALKRHRNALKKTIGKYGLNPTLEQQRDVLVYAFELLKQIQMHPLSGLEHKLFQARRKNKSLEIRTLESQIAAARKDKREKFAHLLDTIGYFFSEREGEKLRIQLDTHQHKKFKTKNISYKDKREFVDFLDPKLDLSAGLNILVIDDNVDSGGTFSIINKLVGNTPGVNVHFYAPLMMKI